MRTERIKTTLIVLSAVAVALGVLTAIVVFYPTGSYQPVVLQNSSTTSFSNFPTTTASSTASSSLAGTTTSTTSTVPTETAVTPGVFSSNYTSPYPVNWHEGNEQFSVVGASLQNNQLTLTLAIQVGNVPDCVPVNMRLVADESGTLRAPTSPAASTFTFPDTQSCSGTPGATYSEPVVFTVNPSAASPYLITTNGASNVFFNVATNTAGGVDIAVPSTSG